MPSGMMIPARNMPPIMGRNGRVVEFGSSSRFPLCQQNLMEEQQNQLEMIQNSAENEMEMNGDEEVDSKSGSDNQEGASGDDQGPNQQPQRKRYHRHTQHQILEMEAFFKECAHPDDKQRKELSQALGLEPLQIKFWFQNKRTQMKNYQERSENSQLRVENEKLLLENMRYKDSIARTSCPTCGGPTTIAEMSLDEHNLTIENAKLREEIDRMSAIATRYAGKPILPYGLPPMAPRSLELGVGNFGRDMVGAGGHFLRPISATNEVEKPMVVDLAVVAMEELYRMAQVGEPLWTMGMDNVTDHLSQEEYFRTFPRRTGQRHIGLKSEASRQTAIVIMNHLNLVEILMNVNQWLNMFCGIVARATTLDVLSTGIAGNYDGALQVMTAEFQISTPLVPTRESVFLRYCKQHAHGIWAVVDVSLDLLGSGPGSRYRRRPSGCVIQEMPSGYSKVIWVEHVDADDRGVHDICKSLVNSSLAFGAKRWVSILERQCQRLANVMALNHPSEVGGMILSQEGRRSLLKLAERMVMSYYSGAGASIAPIWSPVSGGGDEEIRIMSRTCIDNPGRPTGVVLCGTISFWLPVPPARVFDYVREHNTRSEWDILSNVGLVQEIAHIANGRDRANSVSVLRVNSANSSQVNMLIIQETFMESNGYYVIYAPLDAAAMNVIITGDNPDCVAVLPSGFAIFPGPTTHGGGIIEGGGLGGTVLTASFQVLIDPCPTAKIDMGAVATVNNLISCTIQRIKAVFSCNNA